MGPWLNLSSGVIRLRNMEIGSKLDLIVISIHQYAHHSYERFLSQLTTLGPYVHLDI